MQLVRAKAPCRGVSARVRQGCVGLALGIGIAASVVPSGGVIVQAVTGGLVSDLATYREPLLPPLPSGGGTLIDVVFGTTIMRLTDASDGADCRVEYSYWPTFNRDSTRAKALCVINGVNRTRLWTFDAVNFMRGATSQLMPMQLQSSDPIWSGTDPEVIYGHSQSHLLLRYNVVTQTTATVKDFTAIVPSGGQLQQMSMSDDDDVFAVLVV